MGTNVAVVLAGGVGSRVGLDIPKQLVKIAGRTILEHTMAVLQQHDLVEEIVVMMAPGHLDAVHALTRTGAYDKVTQVLEGADTRNGTTQRALAAVPDDTAKVLLHDAVRPLVSDRIITECFEALDRFDAVDVAIASADTIIEVDEQNLLTRVPPRSSLRRGQTPQAFRAGVLRQAYARAEADPDFQATDDCTVVSRYAPDHPIWIVQGDERNMKVTEPIDVYLAEKLFQLAGSSAPRAGSAEAYRAALQDKTVLVFGGSYGIGGDLATLAREHGARVHEFSRSSTGTHVERRADIADAVAQVLASDGRLDYVVNTAGVLPRGELQETSEETVYAATEINYLAPVFIAQETYAHLAETRGSLLLFTSSSYTRGRRGYSLYSSAKAAVVNLTQALADEWSEAGVRVNCVNPERTATPMRSNAFGSEDPDTLLRSAEVAQVSLDTLISPATGHVVDVRRLDPISGY